MLLKVDEWTLICTMHDDNDTARIRSKEYRNFLIKKFAAELRKPDAERVTIEYYMFPQTADDAEYFESCDQWGDLVSKDGITWAYDATDYQSSLGMYGILIYGIIPVPLILNEIRNSKWCR